MTVAVVGLSHKTAPVAVRERLAFPESQLHAPLQQFQDEAIAELVILSTCNRVELYLETPDPQAAFASCVRFLAAYHHLAPETFASYLYHLQEAEAVRHLFRVAASLDSMVVGEPQILGQVKAAYLAAQAAGRTGTVLSQLFARALGVGKAVRSETGISDHPVSVSYAAVELARRIFANLAQRTVLVLGAGDMAALTVRHLRAQGVQQVFVTSRTPARAARLAQELDAKAIPLEAFPAHLPQTDIVISSTSAPQPLIDRAMVQEAMRLRRGEPMFFIDIAVPRDVDPAVNTLENVFLYDIDDLQGVVEANRRQRQQAAAAAEDIVWREVRQFQQWLAARDLAPTITALRQRAELIRRAELERILPRLGHLDERQRRLVEALSSAIVNKLLHTPTVNLKRAAGDPRVRDYVQLLTRLFDLDQ
ncbi:MAG: glutamyl-tRNA reductase [Candidatus Tectimicrobiota bacterium]|nr:MAG: glutamyl-tRNA reductase [Candidatus Tectomicrobia bacterium]